VSVTIPMEGIKHRPDDGLSASKRDEDLPTIQEECPSCSNDLACAQPPSSPAPARKCSPEAPQILPHHAAALRRRGADHLLHVYRVRLEMEARLLDSSDEHILRGGLSTASEISLMPFNIVLPSQRTSHLIGLRVFGGTEGSAA